VQKKGRRRFHAPPPQFVRRTFFALGASLGAAKVLSQLLRENPRFP
jgi:hypothetical protein